MRDIVSPLDGIRSPFGARRGPFSPLSLFAAGEQGAWYDPSDFSTMFQDSAGATPVTAVEQPVGLILDKSNPLVFGSEQVTNGNFSNGSTGWSVSAQSSITGGVARIVSTDGTFQNVGQSKPLAAGWYRLTVDITASVSGGLTFAFSGAGVNFVLGSSVGTKVSYFYISSSTTSTLSFGRTAGVTDITIDNVSVVPMSGNHAFQSTTTSRPVLKQDANGKYYLLFDGVDDWLQTATINPGSVNKCQVFAGATKLVDASYGALTELSASSDVNQGSFGILVSSGSKWDMRLKGDTIAGSYGGYFANTAAAPVTNVATMLNDFSGATIAQMVIPRVNGVVTQSSSYGGAAGIGGGNFGSYALYIGRRGGSSIRFNGRLYGLIVRFSAENLIDSKIARAERWMAAKTGVQL